MEREVTKGRGRKTQCLRVKGEKEVNTVWSRAVTVARNSQSWVAAVGFVHGANLSRNQRQLAPPPDSAPSLIKADNEAKRFPPQHPIRKAYKSTSPLGWNNFRPPIIYLIHDSEKGITMRREKICLAVPTRWWKRRWWEAVMKMEPDRMEAWRLRGERWGRKAAIQCE